MATKKKAQPKQSIRPLLELHLEEPKDKQTAAVRGLRWCITDEEQMKALLKEQHFINPHILVVARSVERFEDGTVRYKETGRWAKPLTDIMMFVSFKSVGENQILATIFDMHRTHQDFDAKVLRRNSGRYNDFTCEVIDGWHGQGESFMSYIYNAPVLKVPAANGELVTACFTTPDPIPVPEEAFAKQKPQRVQDITQRFFPGSKPYDECVVERQYVYSWFIMLFFVPFGYLYKAILLLGSLIAGFRLTKKSWWHLRHPILGKWNGLIEDSNGVSFWFTKKVKAHDGWGGYNVEKPLPIWRIYLTPHLLLGIPAIVYGIVHLPLSFMPQWGFGRTFLYTNGVIIGVGVVIGLGMLVAMGLIALFDRRDAKQPAKTSTNKPRNTKEVKPAKVRKYKWQIRQEAMLNALSQVACDNPDGCVADIKALPPDKRSLELKVLNYKRGHCQPFAEE